MAPRSMSSAAARRPRPPSPPGIAYGPHASTRPRGETAEHARSRAARRSAARHDTSLSAVGALSVAYWHFSGDLRPYIAVQYYPLLCIALLLVACADAALDGNRRNSCP